MFLGRNQRAPTNIDEWAEHYGGQAVCAENPSCVHRPFLEMAKGFQWQEDGSVRMDWKDGSSDLVTIIRPRISPIPNKKSENDLEYVERLLNEMPKKP